MKIIIAKLLNFLQKAALGSVVHRRMKGDGAVAAHLVRPALLGIEVVLTGGAGDDLAVLRYP